MDSVKPCKCGAPSYLKGKLLQHVRITRTAFSTVFREAIGYNSDWKNYAMTDLEFAKCFTDDAFIAVTK
jgi:hypothetical protein